MRDGVTLHADVYRPDAEGRFPVILLRLPYGKHMAGDFGDHDFSPLGAMSSSFKMDVGGSILRARIILSSTNHSTDTIPSNGRRHCRTRMG